MTDFATFVNELHAKTGLDIGVINAWVAREQGVYPGNVLGITSAAAKTKSNPYGLVSYSNQVAGADATANLLQSSSYYRGIIASATGTPQEQALAIAQSPWHLGAMGLQKAGGTDPYYYAGFVQAGILPAGGGSKASQPGPTLQSGPPTNSNVSGNLTTDQWNAIIAGLTPGTRYISATNAEQIQALAKTQGLDLSSLDMTQFYGKSVSTLRDYLAKQGNIPSANANPIDAVTGAFGKFATDVVINVILVGIGIGMIALGLWTLVKGNDNVSGAVKELTKLTAIGVASRSTIAPSTAAVATPSGETEATPTPAAVSVESTVGAGRGQSYSPETPRPKRKSRGPIVGQFGPGRPMYAKDLT